MKMISKRNMRFTTYNGNYTLFISKDFNGYKAKTTINSNSPLDKKLVNELIDTIKAIYGNDMQILDNLYMVISDYLYSDNDHKKIRFITNAGLKAIIKHEQENKDLLLDSDILIDNEGMGILKRYVLDKIDMEQVQELAKEHKFKYIKLPQALLFKEYVKGLK